MTPQFSPNPGPASDFSASGEPLNAAVLFVDLVNSSVFASVLSLEEYAMYLDDFHETCRRQCEFYFKTFLKGAYQEGKDYSYKIAGDELLVFVHSDRSQNDVYQLACLAVTLKAAWLTSEQNRNRLKRRAPVAEISAGIHHGPLWAVKVDSGWHLNGYGINVAKRIESLSRNGKHYRIFLSDQAFKQIHHLLRNMIFSKRLRFEVKGILGDVGMYEVAHTFLDSNRRIDPHFIEKLQTMLVDAINLATQDLWMNDLYQVWSKKLHDRVTDEAMEVCRRVLLHSPEDPSALYHLAQAYQERNDFKMAELLLRELTRYWPHFADGYLEFGLLLREMNQTDDAQDALRRSLWLGAEEAKGDLQI